ncbi:hypothetical protein ABFS83_04G145100 [Erythranthe nasuta]
MSSEISSSMDSRTSPSPWNWIIETLARSKQIDLSLLLGLFKMAPNINDNFGRNAREMLSLRVLESFSDLANPVSSPSSQKIGLDPSDCCEDVLRRILSERSSPHLKPTGSEMSKWDLQPFVDHKRSNLPKTALERLKGAILSENIGRFSSLRERSGLTIGHPIDDNDDDDNLLPDENLVPVSRKRKVTSKTRVKSFKKQNCDVICNELCVQLADVTVSVQQSEGKGCSLEMGLTGPVDSNDSAASKGLVGTDEVLPRGKQVLHCDTELNNKSNEEEQEQDRSIEELKQCDKEVFNSVKQTNEGVDGNILPENVMNVREVEEDNPSCFPQSTNSQEISATTKRRNEEERCSLGEKTHGEVTGQKEPSGDYTNKSASSSKGHMVNDEVLPREKQARDSGTVAPNDELDGGKRQDRVAEDAEGGRNYLHGSITYDKDVDKLEQNSRENVVTVGEAEQYNDVPCDGDGFDDEMTDIYTQKKTFLSSQCTHSQDSLPTPDSTELNHCEKCKKDGKLLSCSSCSIMIHESCLGSDQIFDPKGIFYCPFCTSSRAISGYVEAKKKASSARNNLGNFICSITRQESNTQSRGLGKGKENHLEQEDGLPSELPTSHSPPFGGKNVDSTNKIAVELNVVTRQNSKSPRADGHNQIVALAVRKSRSENTSCHNISETAGRSERHGGGTRSANGGVLRAQEKDLPGRSRRSQISLSADMDEISEESDENSGTSKYFIRVRKPNRKSSYPAIPRVRRKRLPWTKEEENALKKWMRELYDPEEDKSLPYKKILEAGAGVFDPSRTTTDLKDKWRNICKANANSD